MSASFTWTPATPVPPGGGFGLALAAMIAGRVCGNTSLYDDISGGELDEGWVDWLQGVADASEGEVATEARELIAAIRKHKVIRLTVER